MDRETYAPPLKKRKLEEQTEPDEGSRNEGGGAWPWSTSHLQRFEKPKLGLNVDYYPRFFSKTDADVIFRQLEEGLLPYLASSKSQVKIMGKVRQIPRKQTAFGDRGLTYSFSGTTVAAKEWPSFMLRVRASVESALEESFNFVLVNRYNDGTDHIGEHRDDELDLVPRAPIASLSFGQQRDFIFKHKDSRGKSAPRKDIEPVKVALSHGSLLVMRHPTNSMWYHSLPIRKSAPSPRINLTFRRMKA